MLFACPVPTHAVALQLVVVSPLRRTLETAAGVFGAAAPPASLQAAKVAGAVAAATAPAAPAAPSGGWVWMRPQQHKPLEVSRRDIIYLPAAGCAAAAAASACRGDGASGAADGGAGSADRNMPLRILAHEGCRERIGKPVMRLPNPVVTVWVVCHDTVGSGLCSTTTQALMCACYWRAWEFSCVWCGGQSSQASCMPLYLPAPAYTNTLMDGAVHAAHSHAADRLSSVTPCRAKWGLCTANKCEHLPHPPLTAAVLLLLLLPIAPSLLRLPPAL